MNDSENEPAAPSESPMRSAWELIDEEWESYDLVPMCM